jgi:hypothetical protein|tara:strand:- start:1142 stop:1462 length:321 start_codon:yes stop_codon:yes gene_type:complete
VTYIFDIDGTICNTNGSDYDNSTPMYDRIDFINKLYAEGNIIIFQTARGMGRTKNNQIEAIEIFYEYTRKQLDSWNVKYHNLFLGKPAGDYYVDDKGTNADIFFKN